MPLPKCARAVACVSPATATDTTPNGDREATDLMGGLGVSPRAIEGA
jgi:hypothetical protein